MVAVRGLSSTTLSFRHTMKMWRLIEKAYREGWDKIRVERLERQKKLGVVAATTELTPRSPIPLPGSAARNGSATTDGNNPAWNSLPAARQHHLSLRMAVYAAMVTGMDQEYRPRYR